LLKNYNSIRQKNKKTFNNFKKNSLIHPLPQGERFSQTNIIKKIEKKESTRYCDFCEKKSEEPYSSNSCNLCDRDICLDHKVRDPDCIDADYIEYICIECFEISKSSYEKMKKLEDEIEYIYDEIRKKCRENRKVKEA